MSSSWLRWGLLVGIALGLAACALGQSPDLPSVTGGDDGGGTPTGTITGTTTGGLDGGGTGGASAAGGGPNCWTELVEDAGGAGGMGGASSGGASSGGATLTIEVCE